eukprot:9476272-Pyramimonas_sp.AAC.2
MVTGYLLKAYDIASASPPLQEWILQKRQGDSNFSKLSGLQVNIESIDFATSQLVASAWGDLDSLSFTHQLRYRYVLLLLETASSRSELSDGVRAYLSERVRFLREHPDDFVSYEGAFDEEDE